MAVIIFSLYADDGTPVIDALPAWLAYKTPDGTPGWTDVITPEIYNFGDGSYYFDVPEAQAAAGVAYLIDAGLVDINPRYIVGAAGPVVAFLVTQDGVLFDPSADPPFFNYYRELPPGGTIGSPPIRMLGEDGGLCAFALNEGETTSIGVMYRVECPGADVAYYDGVVDPVTAGSGTIEPPIVFPPEDQIYSNRLAEAFRPFAYYPPDGSRFLAKTCQLVVKFNPEGSGNGDVRLRSFGIRYRVIDRRPS